MAEPTLSELAGWAEKLADPNAATPVGLLWQALETCAAALRRAKQEIAGLEDEIDAFRKDLQTAIAERGAALERCRVIEAALRRYGAHYPDCPRWDGEANKCVCGLDEALAPPTRPPRRKLGRGNERS